ncbi:MAG: cytidine deaminase [Pseudomonadota bacterium]
MLLNYKNLRFRPKEPRTMSSDLIAAAAAAAGRAYAPYSRFQVGAALRSASGAIFSGCNIENAAYPQGWCAEPSALSAMIMAGEAEVVEICIWADSAAPCTPCGGCRQKLAEFGSADTIVISAGPTGERRRWTLGGLLPEAFSLEEEA